MKSSIRAFIILTAFFIQHSVVGQSYFRKDYPDVWQRATMYTLEIAEAMPANKYAFKPMGESMSFQEQMVHLVLNLSYLSGQVTGERIDFLQGKKPEALTKEEVVLMLGTALNHVSLLIKNVDEQTLRESISFGGVEMPKENIFYLMRDHTTHHRGQAILYLRLNGVKAPDYVGW